MQKDIQSCHVHTIWLNRLNVIDTYMQYTTCDVTSANIPWDLGSAPAKRVGQEEVGGFQHWGPDSMVASGISCRKPLVSTGWGLLPEMDSLHGQKTVF